MTTATATEAPALRLNRLEISNYQRIEAIQVEAAGRHLNVVGPNGAGKTSAVGAIWAALGGKAPAEPIHKGAERAKVTLDLGDYRVERVWTEKSSRLVVTTRDGSKVKEPADLLKGLLGKYSLDPGAFLSRRDQDQVDELLAVCGVEPPVGHVLAITGDAHSPKPGESAEAYLMRLSADETGLYFVRRREAHRVAGQKAAALEEQRRTLDRLGGAVRPDEQESRPSDLLGELQQLQQQAEAKQTLLANAAASQRELEDGRALLTSLKDELQRKNDEAGQVIVEIEKLRAKLEELKKRAGELAARVARGEDVVGGLASAALADREAADQATDPTPALESLRRRMRDAESSNQQMAQRRLAAEQLDRLAAESVQAVREHGALDSVLDRLRDLRAHLLDGVDLGVPGLAVGDGELRLNAVPFRQASQAEQIRVACAVAFRQNPKLKLLRLDDAEHLDARSKSLVRRLADEHGWQVIMAAVADTDSLTVEIIDKEPT